LQINRDDGRDGDTLADVIDGVMLVTNKGTCRFLALRLCVEFFPRLPHLLRCTIFYG
jgi:hypothetical protein